MVDGSVKREKVFFFDDFWRLPPIHWRNLTNTTISLVLFQNVTVVRDREIRTVHREPSHPFGIWRKDETTILPLPLPPTQTLFVWTHHAIFLCVTSPKNVCVGRYLLRCFDFRGKQASSKHVKLETSTTFAVGDRHLGTRLQTTFAFCDSHFELLIRSRCLLVRGLEPKF